MPLEDGRSGAGFRRPRGRPRVPQPPSREGNIGADEPNTRRALEVIPAQEEGRADVLADLLVTFDPKKSV